MSTQCRTPYMVTLQTASKGKTTIGVPCGRCPFCKKRRVSGWSFRLMQEDKVSESSIWVTLTYSPAHVPITPRAYQSLSKRHIQLFMKKLRHTTKRKIKYYICGEYGSRTMRPHYHALIFNTTKADIEKCWQYGQMHFGTVTGASVGYTLKYMQKDGKVPMHRNDDRLKEFQMCSTRLGASYVTDDVKRWHHSDLNNRCYCTLADGRKISMPRYIKDLVYDAVQRESISNHLQTVIDKKITEYEQKHGSSITEQEHQRNLAVFRNASIIHERGRTKI